MMKRSLDVAAVIAMVTCGGTAQAQETLTFPSPDTAGLAREVPDLLQVSGVPGLSMAVVRAGQVVWSGAFGTVNDSAKRPLDAGTVFEAASLSKPVFAYLVLRLADRREFDLDRPLLDMLEYPRLAQDPRARSITARTVLSHATGLPNWGGDTLRLRFAPGTDYGYSGEGFLFLQKALERVTGRPLDALAEREVFRPLGMTRSSFVWQKRFAGDAAWATDWLWRVAPVNRYADGNAAASLVTTAEDYARFVAAVLTGRGLSPEMWKEFLTPGRETDPGIHIGLGIRLEDGPSGRRFFHSGSNGRRFTCYMAGDLGTGVGMVFFTNTYGGTSLVRPLASRVFGDAHPSRHWDWFDRHDDPRRLAVRSVQRAAVDRRRGRCARAPATACRRARPPGSPSRISSSSARSSRVAAWTRSRSRCFGRRVAEAPDSATARTSRSVRRWSRPETSRRRSRRTSRSVGRWTRRAEKPAGICGGPKSGRRPERAALRPSRPRCWRASRASYRERTVVLRDGRLHYGGGADPESPMVPMGADLFELEQDPDVRVRFLGDGKRPAAELVAIYRDGSVDRWSRAR